MRRLLHGEGRAHHAHGRNRGAATQPERRDQGGCPMTKSDIGDDGRTAAVLARLATEALPDSEVCDLIVDGPYAGLRWMRDGQAGLTLLRIVSGLPVQSWTAVCEVGSGQWPGGPVAEDLVALAARRANSDASATRATMDRYLEIRADQSRAEELRPMFADPMVVHGPGPTLTSGIDAFIARVRDEPRETPGVRTRWHHIAVAGDRAFVRWTYFDGPDLIQAGHTLYALRDGVIVERWQAALPGREGWF
ncbi:MAG: nuclear transport factor 2 family protein [Chloroflexi bacterium CFX7]|nr:nuclear transport factor 2 family protein [Chloroflexi bacterium CFX7]